jgi:SAM-dependent methyltransferase
MSQQIQIAPSSAMAKNSLPMQLRLSLSEDIVKFEGILDRIEGILLSCLRNSSNTGTSLVCQIVRLQDHHHVTDLVLPARKIPCLLVREGKSYVSNPELDAPSVEELLKELEGVLRSSGSGRLLKQVVPESEDRQVKGSNQPADFVLYVPGCSVHVRILVTEWRPAYNSEIQRFSYAKEGVALWNVDVCAGETPGVSMWLAAETLQAQFIRMQAGQTHGFSLLVRDFLGNATALARHIGGQEQQRKRKLFFPGMFDLAAEVKQHYNDKVERFVTQDRSEAGSIRKYNNLVKSILLSEFVPERSVVLDLACGHGQDLMKFKSKRLRAFIGTDISEAALAEARRRHSSNRVPMYPAAFIQGNLMMPEIFEQIKRAAEAMGVTDESPFDVISIQLALHYIVGSADDAKLFMDRVSSLLKPGGKFIASFPCCDRIGRRIRTIAPVDETTFTEFVFGNETYKVTFTKDELLKLVPALAEPINNKSVEAMESVIEQLDFEEVVNTASNAWGGQYKFWLVQTIDNQEEYIVPLSACESLLTSQMQMTHQVGGNFAEILSHYTEKDSKVVKDFKKHNPDAVLNDDEDEVFKFYRALVFEKK